MRLAAAFLLLLLLASTGRAALAADPITGVWGVVRDGAPRCAGTFVHAFKDGRYFLVLPDLGSLAGVAHYIVDHAVYEIQRGVVTIGPGLQMLPRIEERRYRLARGRPLTLVPENGGAPLRRCRDFIFVPPE